MIKNILTDKELTQLMMLIRDAQRIVVCGHVSPDGDAMGSCLGWADYLYRLGKEPTVIMPNHCPDFLKWLPGYYRVLHFNDRPAQVQEAFGKADLVCCVDFCEPQRVQDMQATLEACKAPRLVIDHHTNPDHAFATAMLISQPQASSSAEVVFRLINQLGGWPQLTRSAATCLYCGIMTDTGNLAWSADDPELYQIISLLMRKHIDKGQIYRNVYYSYSADRLRFIGHVLADNLRTYPDHHASLFTITRQELTDYHYVRGDAEGLVNMPLQIKGMRLVISLREDTERDVVRVSLRSVDDFPCNLMAEEFFHGGGHLNAAGGELPFPMEEAVKTAEAAIAAYAEQLGYKPQPAEKDPAESDSVNQGV